MYAAVGHPPTNDAAADGAALFDALTAGRTYCGIGTIGAAGGFRFSATSDAGEVSMGDETRLDLHPVLHLDLAYAQLPPATRPVLICGGVEVPLAEVPVKDGLRYYVSPDTPGSLPRGGASGRRRSPRPAVDPVEPGLCALTVRPRLYCGATSFRGRGRARSSVQARSPSFLQCRPAVTIDPQTRSLSATPSILIVLMGSLGDVARALPVASLLAQHRPGARVSWLVDSRWRELLVDHPAIDRLITFPRERTPRAFARLIGELRAEPLDLTLDLQRHLKSGLCSLVSGAARRIGFHPADTREGNHHFNSEHISRCRPDLSKLRHYLVFAEHLGLPVPPVLDFGLTRFADPRFLPEPVCGRGAGFVAVVMGSSWRSKDWTPDGYRGLVSLIERETPFDVVLLGDGSQRDLAERVSPAGVNSRIVNLAGRTTLSQLCATLAAARAAVGPDSGPGHLAAALGTPAVTLIGPTRVERVAPYGCEHLAVRSPVDCDPCLRRTCRRRAGRCMDAITPAMVWQALAPLVQRESA